MKKIFLLLKMLFIFNAAKAEQGVAITAFPSAKHEQPNCIALYEMRYVYSNLLGVLPEGGAKTSA